jgi:nitrile hydratase
MPHDSPTDPSSKNSELPDEMALKVKSLETLLVSKGLVDPAALDKIVDFYSNQVGPRNGAYLVARSWVEKEFSSKLLLNPTPILKELGFHGRQGEHVVVLKNTREVHNLVVCTLCSCYPWPLLGLPPSWYKSDEYRSRSVLEPRKVLKEFGLDIPKETKVKVWDSTAEIRYLVLPMRPEGTDGMSIDELSKLVTRDSMIGAGYALTPEKINE